MLNLNVGLLVINGFFFLNVLEEELVVFRVLVLEVFLFFLFWINVGGLYIKVIELLVVFVVFFIVLFRVDGVCFLLLKYL